MSDAEVVSQPETWTETDETPGGPVVYTDDEIAAMKEIRAKLMEEHGVDKSRVGNAFLAVATLNCKLRVDETVEKIMKLLELMEQLDCPDGFNDELWKPSAKHQFHSYPPVGIDSRGCSTTWIRKSGKVIKEEERHHVHGCIMQYLAVHSDAKTLRNGVSFVIDLTGKDDMVTEPNIGNEQIIQNFYQAIPQRPQVILIAGTSFLVRTFVNAAIAVASLFVKQKVLERIDFVTVEDAASRMSQKNAPKYLGGGGGGVDSYAEWVEQRLQQLPIPDL